MNCKIEIKASDMDKLQRVAAILDVRVLTHVNMGGNLFVGLKFKEGGTIYRLGVLMATPDNRPQTTPQVPAKKAK